MRVMLMLLCGLVMSGLAWADSLTGRVFHDANGDGYFQSGEPGLPGVLVSNGREVVRTDDQGRFELPVHDDMDVFVIQPSGWRAPLDDRGVPRIHWSYKRHGSPPLRFGGLPAGQRPETLDFPLRPVAGDDHAFRCAVIGDSQTYSNQEVSWFRDGTVVDLLEEQLGEDDCLIYLGDVVGDDLDLLDRLLRLGAQAGAPQWLVFGNHDLDFDATDPADSADSWRARALPAYYAFEQGEVLFVALNNVVYPCGEADMARPGREFCAADAPRYNGRVSRQQMDWLAALLAHWPDDRLVVLLHHIPLVSFSDAERPQHLTDNAAEIHALLAGRPALSLAGHTHTLENHDPGQWFEGWQRHLEVGPLPFRHIVAGAASGGWWLGDVDVFGIPMALQRMGAPRGVLMLDVEGSRYRERWRASRLDPALGQWLSLNTPDFRRWYAAIAEWMAEPEDQRDPVPPVSSHDLEDGRLVTPADLAEGAYLVVNVWLGSASTEVKARIAGQAWQPLERTQAGQGEPAQRGDRYVDPFALARQATSARRAVVSRSGNPRTQGHEAFRGRSYQGVPGPQDRRWPDANVHLWRLRLPESLPLGTHRVDVQTTDRHGQSFNSTVLIEVSAERPARFWQADRWAEPAG